MKRYALSVAFLILMAACSSSAPPPKIPTVLQDRHNSFAAWQARNKSKVVAFTQFLDGQNVSGVLPVSGLLRSASAWEECKAEPFAIPPRQQWASVASVLRLLQHLQSTRVISSVEVYSGYRNPELNACAGGAAGSAHTKSFALDFRVQDDADPTEALCRFWLTEGKRWNMGYSRYPSGRIHIDTAGYRTWGYDHTGTAVACRAN